MTSPMRTVPRTPPMAGNSSRTRLLLVEVAALAVCVGVDVAIVLRSLSQAGSAHREMAVLTAVCVPSIATLTLLRRWFPERTLFLGTCVLISCLPSLIVGIIGHFSGEVPTDTSLQPFATQVVCLLVVVSALCRRRSLVCAFSFSAVAGLVTTADLGLGTPGALGDTAGTAVALSWGFAVAMGAILRDTDRRERAVLASIRSGERLSLARDLHDLVAHHVAGIVVQAQAVEAVAAAQGGRRADDLEMISEIARAGSRALQAIRYLIGTARDDRSATATNLYEAVVNAVDEDREQSVYLSLPSDLGSLECPAELVVTLHRVVLESLTNAAKYSATDSRVHVTVQVGAAPGIPAALITEIVNERGTAAVPAPSRGGYGLVGMAERVAMIGGKLEAGPYGEDYWKVTASLPLAITSGSAEYSLGVI